ncbi:hypothetical protein QFZ62_001771 [Clavibacter sp. B3I6]|uniref:hypothetical protein n=1 Tax=Clavibacter sp. B3I6 TaxID=3042268 RepID=UPI00277DDD05|nr:hypothetical protein [Clavibacter sp. B3I6]MDQ0744463.1 hypothetical protein [Clavibacter sp. B3I6]
MRIPTLAQAVADGAAAAGLVLFALIVTDVGTGTLALAGLALLGLSAAVRLAAVASARRLWPRAGGAAGRPPGRVPWRRWILALWVVQGVAFVAGLLLAHSSFGAVATAGIVGVVVAVASAALAGAAARRAARGSGAGFVDSASLTAYA